MQLDMESSVCIWLLTSHPFRSTGTYWSLSEWCTSRQTLGWNTICWRTCWRCVKEFSILFKACSCGTTCCSALAMCCQMLPSQRMSQKARYDDVYNCNFSLSEMLMGYSWHEGCVEDSGGKCYKFEENLPEILALRKTVCSKCETHLEKIML
jgi:hypothetical protein